ncbi:APO protein 4, mitochondrial-like [Malania oleifera]|uniref:APO protein 4, mitochondrial-like n=1 Tax=Malania oleifera TaxID=397392 RepID=UPI0025AE4188|nr:APO protein 4, mitochondrial-like [Malania oleifera]
MSGRVGGATKGDGGAAGAVDVEGAAAVCFDWCKQVYLIIDYNCRFYSEIYVGGKGHSIQTCHGYKRCAKSQVHEWISGGLNDILVPVETFHLQSMFQEVIKHQERFDFNRVPAVVELCLQAGAYPWDGYFYSSSITHGVEGAQSLPSQDLSQVARITLKAVRLCGVFKNESWRGTHFWKKADVDDLVPPKIVWRRRPHDPPVLLDKGRGFYGRAPAVIDLCTQAGAIAPSKIFAHPLSSQSLVTLIIQMVEEFSVQLGLCRKFWQYPENF